MRIALIFALALAVPCAAAQAACERYAPALESMRSADQALRQRLDHQHAASASGKRLQEHLRIVDRTNTARLKKWIAQCGWPDPDRHGKGAVHAAWLLAQHADHDLAFQEQVLVLIGRMAAQRGEAPDRTFAYLSDRIAVARRRPQPYGTQLLVPVDQPCAMRFEPMDERGAVERRRAAMGLPPLDIYLKFALERSNCPADGGIDDAQAPPPGGAGH